MITAIPKEQAAEKSDLEKDYKGITKEKLIGMEESVARRLILDSCILDEIERDIDRLDGVAIRRLIRKRMKYMYNKPDIAKEETKN
ncbi:MAG: hypothetical protein K6E75_03410 [Lachnospiraceae bacterium]|nr:hypothetical protein [Lachnospiraceae bacterium]